jgi:hypothetical protein
MSGRVALLAMPYATPAGSQLVTGTSSANVLGNTACAVGWLLLLPAGGAPSEIIHGVAPVAAFPTHRLTDGGADHGLHDHVAGVVHPVWMRESPTALASMPSGAAVAGKGLLDCVREGGAGCGMP